MAVEPENNDEPNEIVAASRAAKRQVEAAERAIGKPRDWPLAAMGLGIGSAALAGALIYASRSRAKK